MNKIPCLTVATALVAFLLALPSARADVMSGPCEFANEGDACTTLADEAGTCDLIEGILECVATPTSAQGGNGGASSSGVGGAGGGPSSGGDEDPEGGCSVGALGGAGGSGATLLLALAGLGLTLRKRR